MNKEDNFNKISEELQLIASNIKLDVLPLNVEEERGEFFSSSNSYNPKFIYKEKDAERYRKNIKDISGIEAKLGGYNLPVNIEGYLRELLNYYSFYNEFSFSVGTDRFGILGDDLFKMPMDLSFDYFDYIKLKYLANNDAIINAEEIKIEFEKALKHYDIEDVAVLLEEVRPELVRVTPTKIIIGNKVKRNSLGVKKLIVHELESHLLRNINSKKQFNSLLKSSLKPDFNIIEEGFAVFNEFTNNTLDNASIKTYAGRYWAGTLLKKSFVEIFNDLTAFFTKEESFEIAFRLKRGMGDTSKPGGYKKDMSYLKGFDYIRSKFNIGNKAELYGYLYLGKTTFSDKEFINEPGVSLNKDIILPSWLSKPQL